MNEPSHVDVTITRAFEHPAIRVFDAWLTPRVAARFLFATAGGEGLRAEMDGVAGGKFRFTERRTKDDGSTWDADHVGTIVEVDRPRRIVLTFCADVAPCVYDEARATRITITIAPRGDGACTLVLRHVGVPIAHAGRAENGWRTIVESLVRTLDGAGTPA